MTRVYRILRKAHAKKPLDGADGFGERWRSVGTRLAYTAEHLSLAIIEYFIHIDPEDPPKDLVAVKAAVPESVSRTSISARQLPANWGHSPSLELAEIGDRFVRDRRAAMLIVRPALAPAEWNWLINPQHPEFSRIRLHSIEAFKYDPRFFK